MPAAHFILASVQRAAGAPPNLDQATTPMPRQVRLPQLVAQRRILLAGRPTILDLARRHAGFRQDQNARGVGRVADIQSLAGDGADLRGA